MAERKAYNRTKKRKRCLTPEIFKHYQDSKYYYLGSMFIDSEDTLLQNKSILGLHKSYNRRSGRQFCFTPNDDLIWTKVLKKMEESPTISPNHKQMIYNITVLNQSKDKQCQRIKLRKGHRKLDLIPSKSLDQHQKLVKLSPKKALLQRCCSESNYTTIQNVINYEEFGEEGSQYHNDQQKFTFSKQIESYMEESPQVQINFTKVNNNEDEEEEKCEEQSAELVQFLKQKRQRHGRTQGVVQVNSSQEKQDKNMNAFLNIQKKSNENENKNKFPFLFSQLSKKLETIQENEENESRIFD